MSKPVITVLMSVYNAAKYIPEAIESILSQTFRDYEFIIINDGSTDGTKEILATIDDARIRVIHQENHGLTYSLNIGLSLAQGKYIARIDADDYCHPDRLLHQYEEMEKRMDLAVLGTWATQVDGNGKEIDYKVMPVGQDEVIRNITKENPFIHGSVIMRKSILDEVGGYRESFRYAQDYDLFLRLSDQHPMDNLPEYLYYSRHNPDMVSIRSHTSQVAYANLARHLHTERSRTGQDALDRGESVAEWLENDSDDSAGLILYYRHLISRRCRKGDVAGVRQALNELSEMTSIGIKYRLIQYTSYLGPRIMRWVTSLWDTQK